jgi:hypothetical protein
MTQRLGRLAIVTLSAIVVSNAGAAVIHAPAGRSVKWNPAGRAAGPYFCRLAAGSQVRWTRLVLLP